MSNEIQPAKLSRLIHPCASAQVAYSGIGSRPFKYRDGMADRTGQVEDIVDPGGTMWFDIPAGAAR